MMLGTFRAIRASQQRAAKVDALDQALTRIASLETDLAAAMLRLGSLGLNPKMPTDLAELCAQLGAMKGTGHKSWPTHYLNPDGHKAVTAIEHLNTKLQAAETELAARDEVLRECGVTLKPFANVVEYAPPDVGQVDVVVTVYREEGRWTIHLGLEEFRAARTTLAKIAKATSKLGDEL